MFKKRIISLTMAVLMATTLVPSWIGKTEAEVKAASTWRSSLYPENWTPGYKNSNGQFLHDFSYAGYERGEKEIPASFSGKNVNVNDYGADPTGTNDSTNAIQSAINDVQNAGGGTVYLPEGTYKVKPASNENSCALRISGSNILFKGAGVGKTFIRCYAENMRYCQIINVSPTSGTWDSANDGKYYYLSQDIPETPTTTIHLNDVGNLAVGDWVIIRSDRTQSWINDHNMSGFWSATLNPTTMGTTFYRQITKVNATAKTIEIDIPTRYWMKTRDNARVYKVAPKQSNVGLMDFSIGNKANSNTSGWGEEDYKTSGTGAYNTNNAFLIKFALNVNCFAKNISTYQAGNASKIHMSSNGLDISKSRSITIENCDFSHPQYEGGGGNGYGMNLCGQECLIKDCSSTSARHSFSFKYAYASGNVIHHYTSTDPKYGSDFHMYLSMSNLIDCEELNGDFCETNVRPYGGTAGNYHGYTSTQTVFWNTKGNYYKSGSSYIIDSRQYKYGYIIGTQGAATAVKTTPTVMSSQYGTVDTAPEDYKEGIGAGATLVPQSLYYDQLERRLSGAPVDTGIKTQDVATKAIPGTFNATEYNSATSEVTNMTDNGVNYVGNLVSGSSLTYKVKVAKGGDYRVTINTVAGNSSSVRTLTLYSDTKLLGTVTVPNTDSWTNFQPVTLTVSYASAGEKNLIINASGSANISSIKFESVEDIQNDVPTNKSKYVVGYLPSYRTYAVDSIDFSALTHCCLAFMTYKNGTLTSGFSANDTTKIVNKCHSNGVKAMIAIGGGGGFDTSDNPFGTAEKRTAFVNQIMNYVNQYNLDGVDIDIEVTDKNTWANFESLCAELSLRLKAQGKLFTMAASSWFTDPITTKTYTYFDFINLMSYDNAFGDGPVAPMSQITNLVSYYKNRGVSQDRMTIGVPFYGYKLENGQTKDYTYAQIIAMDANNAHTDTYNGIYFNGADTIRQKAEYSKDYAGIMIWELGQDASGNNSLLKVIKDTMGTNTQPVDTTPAGFTKATTGTYAYSGNWGCYFGNWNGSASGAYKGGVDDPFSMYIDETNKGVAWIAQASYTADVTPGHTYKVSVDVTADKAGSVGIKEDLSNENISQVYTALEAGKTTTVTGTFTVTNDAIKVMFELGKEINPKTTITFSNMKIEDVTPVTKEAKIEINGFQISTSVEGSRTVYSVSDPNKEVTEVGLVYGLADYVTKDDMVYNSTSEDVFDFNATEVGKLNASFSEMEDSTSYAMTMLFIKSAEYYNAPIYVRAYAKLADGKIIYSDVAQHSVYEVSRRLYENHKMSTKVAHDYIYNNILKVVNPSYKEVDFDWGNVLVK